MEVEVPVRDDARDDDARRRNEADDEAHLKDLLVGDVEEELHQPDRASVEAVHDQHGTEEDADHGPVLPGPVQRAF